MRKTTINKEQGGIKADSARRIRSLISKILHSQGLYAEANKLPAINVKSKEVGYVALSDESYIEIGKFLFKGYEIYMQHIINNTQPELCPLFDEERLKRLGLSNEDILSERRKARLRVAGYTANWLNSAISIAILLIYMFTGINPTPLFNLRHSDVKLKKNIGDCYILQTVKARAGYKRQTNEIGFTAFSKKFIETWLSNTKKWSSDQNFLVFPRVIRNNKTNEARWGSWLELSPQRYINDTLEVNGLPKVSAMIFRKTRASMLMRALNDIAEVADANNNDIITTDRHYINGNKDLHDRSLAAAFQVQAEMVSGVEKNKAIDNVVWKFKDPLTEIEYINARHKRPNKTKSGLGCDGASSDKINKSKRKFIKINPDLNSCIDFLDCFECPSHALVAELDDIWMMLSFQDSLNEVLERPSLNSVPSNRFFKIRDQVVFILDKLKNKAPDVYYEACEKNKYRAHPLYDDSNAIDDLMRIYA